MNIDILIPLYVDHEDRIINLKRVLKILTGYGITSIYVREYYKDSPKYTGEDCIYSSVEMQDDVFNKMKCINEMVEQCKQNALAIYDVDVIILKKDIMQSLEMLNNGYEFVFPYNGEFYNIPKTHIDKFLNEGIINLDDCELANPNSYGGCVIFKRGVFIEGGMCNPNFKNVGFDDNEIQMRFYRLGYKMGRTSSPLLHLEHYRSETSVEKSPHLNYNMGIYNHICNVPIDILKQEISTWVKEFNIKQPKSIYCVDNIFSHSNHISIPDNNVRQSENIIWNFDVPDATDDIVVYTENSFDKLTDDIPNRVAWLIESPEIHKAQYEWIKHNHNKFKHVITHNKKLVDIGENFVFVPLGGSWLWNDEIQIYNKTKNISIIASFKAQTIGHKLRHVIVARYNNFLDIYGSGYNPITRKIYGLKDYRFSVCIENIKEDYYFSEKIMDCFLSGTIPIYWGCPSISKFFDERGVLSFDNFEQFDQIIKKCDADLYSSLLPYVIYNFKKAHDYLLSEDWAAKNTHVLNYDK